MFKGIRLSMLRMYFNGLLRFIVGVDRVLDIGGGDGSLCEVLGGVDYYVVVDVDYEALTRVRRLSCNGVVECLASDAHYIPLRDRSWRGVAILHNVLHHLEDPKKGLEEVTRVLSEGSCLYIRDPNINTWVGKLIMLIEKFLGYPAKLITPKKLANIMKSLAVEKVEILEESIEYTVRACIT